MTINNWPITGELVPIPLTKTFAVFFWKKAIEGSSVGCISGIFYCVLAYLTGEPPKEIAILFAVFLLVASAIVLGLSNGWQAWLDYRRNTSS